jgi:cell division protein FtsA
MIYDQIQNSGFGNSIPAGVVITGGGALTVNAKEICGKVIPLPLRIASPPRLGGIVDDILNPSYTSSVGLLMYALNSPENVENSPKKSVNIGGIFGKLKSLIEPLLP